jgi:hypothetical protein
MAKTFYTSGTGSQQTLTPSQNEKVAIYDTIADAEADLANLEAGQIVATPDTGDELAQPVDVIESGNMHTVTSNAVANSNAMPVNEVTANNLHSVTSGAVYSALSALRTEYGFKIGNLMIETVSINIGTATFTNGRAVFDDVYNFIAPFTSVPNVVLSSQNDADYGFCIPIGIVRTKSKISRLSLFRDNNDTVYSIFIKGIAIGT